MKNLQHISYLHLNNIIQDIPVGIQKPIDLQKIFTPAEDAEEIVPQKNRK